ncbi:MAG TPA: hypothetical protein VN157_17720, partial [Caulobacter sp.]|nr:hypothetical protein [Caulobacter sp.]
AAVAASGAHVASKAATPTAARKTDFIASSVQARFARPPYVDPAARRAHHCNWQMSSTFMS